MVAVALSEVNKDMGLVTYFAGGAHRGPASTAQYCASRILSVSIRGRRVELSLHLSPEPRASRSCQSSRREDCTAVSFWNSLDAAERRAFTAVAHERTFARGARLMREGEQANHVMVILGGWTRITVDEGSGERVIAERGPGQLVGERGALRVNIRSATVIALETVHALVMKTEDFASFISAHPRVLDIVESQIYDRLTQEPAEQGPDDWPDNLSPQLSGYPASQTQRLPVLAGENCTVLFTDVVGFGAHYRIDRDRRIIRKASLGMMRTALGALWEECISEDRGDGLLIVAPPKIPTTRLMERLHRELPGELWLHNRTYGESVRIRLRVAVNVGPVVGDPLGMSGEAIIRTARLLEAPALKESMASTDAVLGITVSDFVYETVIKHAEGWINPGEYGAVQVNVKESSIPAWMHLTDVGPGTTWLRNELIEAESASRTRQAPKRCGNVPRTVPSLAVPAVATDVRTRDFARH